MEVNLLYSHVLLSNWRFVYSFTGNWRFDKQGKRNSVNSECGEVLALL